MKRKPIKINTTIENLASFPIFSKLVSQQINIVAPTTNIVHNINITINEIMLVLLLFFIIITIQNI
jgi:hypothetical protein